MKEKIYSMIHLPLPLGVMEQSPPVVIVIPAPVECLLSWW